MFKRSDGQECKPPLFDPFFKGELCPKCKGRDYGITCGGSMHNSVHCSCGWVGCQCELLVLEEKTGDKP